jgi:hypothetical protein
MFSIKEIEQIMKDTADTVTKQKEIDLILSGQLTQEVEDDVLRELHQLVEAELEAAEEAKLPEAPTDQLLGNNLKEYRDPLITRLLFIVNIPLPNFLLSSNLIMM